MRQLVLEIEDEAYGNFMAMVALCPQIKVVGECNIKDVANTHDLCMRQAIVELIEDGVIRRPRDYGWIMLALDQKAIKDFEGFSSHQAFIDYLKMLGVEALPCRTTLYNIYNITIGEYPEWTFLDEPNNSEILRRKNLIVRLISAYMRAKREKLNR